MTVNTSVVNISNIEILRLLIINNLQSIIKGCSIIDAALPIPGEPILALTSNSKPVLVCFDIMDTQQALMAGLSAVDHTKKQHALIMRLHPQLEFEKSNDSIILVIIAPSAIPGADYCFRQDGSILFYTFQGISVNGETALLIEPAAFNSTVTRKPDDNTAEINNNFIEQIGSSLLSKKEKEYFNEL